ncbi:MAG: DUF1499 domain-containing protein [Beijerinckiaceae bacterium]
MRRAVLEDPVSRSALWSRRLAWFALAVLGIGTLVVRSGQIAFPEMAAVLGAALLLALLAALLASFSLVGIWREGYRGAGKAIAALLITGAILAYPAFLLLKGLTLPVINDISTDLVEPPVFSRSRATLAARGAAIRDLPPPDVRAKQRESYGGLVPTPIEQSPDEVFAIALTAAKSMGWQIIEAVPPGGRGGAGRIEAIARTMLLRFPDDIVVRIKPQANGARIDMRSASRYGRHDFGANAARIEKFMAEVARAQDAQ